MLWAFSPLRDVFVLLCILEKTITEQICLIHKSYKLKSSFHHVKGKKDSAINYNKLYLPPQLNAQSEKLACKFHTFDDL